MSGMIHRRFTGVHRFTHRVLMELLSGGQQGPMSQTVQIRHKRHVQHTHSLRQNITHLHTEGKTRGHNETDNGRDTSRTQMSNKYVHTNNTPRLNSFPWFNTHTHTHTPKKINKKNENLETRTYADGFDFFLFLFLSFFL